MAIYITKSYDLEYIDPSKYYYIINQEKIQDFVLRNQMYSRINKPSSTSIINTSFSLRKIEKESYTFISILTYHIYQEKSKMYSLHIFEDKEMFWNHFLKHFDRYIDVIRGQEFYDSSSKREDNHQ